MDNVMQLIISVFLGLIITLATIYYNPVDDVDEFISAVFMWVIVSLISYWVIEFFLKSNIYIIAAVLTFLGGIALMIIVNSMGQRR